MFGRLVGRGVPFAVLGMLAFALTAGPAQAAGEQITDVLVRGNSRTNESTVRSIAGISIGDISGSRHAGHGAREAQQAAVASLRDVNVWWKLTWPRGLEFTSPVHWDKFPWAPVPTGSWSSNNKSIGLIFVHGNLLGRGKQLLIGGRLATIDSGIAGGALLGPIALRDLDVLAASGPATTAGDPRVSKLRNDAQRRRHPTRESLRAPRNAALLVWGRARARRRLVSASEDPARMASREVRVFRSRFRRSQHAPAESVQLIQATAPGTIGVGRAALTLDYRAREFALMSGGALDALLDYAGSLLGSDFTYWRAGLGWQEGIKLFRAHNLIYGAGTTIGHDLPFWAENTAGGSNLRGYLDRQFRGDTQVWGNAEYHFPLFSVRSLDFRALVFYDVQAIWFRTLPTTNKVGPDAGGTSYYQRDTPDARTFPTMLRAGFSFDQSVHNDVGAGLRFFLRSVAVPLVGVDAGYGIEARNWQLLVVVGV